MSGGVTILVPSGAMEVVPTVRVHVGALIAGGAGPGGAADHGALNGLGDDDHPQYAKTDGTRGNFAPNPTEARFESASTEWVVNHNRDRPVLVDVTDLAGARLFCDVEHTSANQLRVRHTTPVTGIVTYL